MLQQITPAALVVPEAEVTASEPVAEPQQVPEAEEIVAFPEEKVDSLEAGDNLPQPEPKAEADKGDSLAPGAKPEAAK